MRRPPVARSPGDRQQDIHERTVRGLHEALPHAAPSPCRRMTPGNVAGATLAVSTLTQFGSGPNFVGLSRCVIQAAVRAVLTMDWHGR